MNNDFRYNVEQSEEITINFSKFSVEIKDSFGEHVFFKRDAYNNYIKFVTERLNAFVEGFTNIVNLQGPGLISTNTQDNRIVKYFLIPHGIRKFFYNSGFLESLKMRLDVDDIMLIEECSRKLDDTNVSVVDIYYPPMLLIAISDSESIIQKIYGGFITHQFYDFVNMNLTVTNIKDFNKIELCSEISNTYDDFKLCLDSDITIKNSYSGMMSIFKEVHNSDLFKSEADAKIFKDRVKLANEQHTFDSMMDSIVEISKAMSNLNNKTIRDIIPLKGESDDI